MFGNNWKKMVLFLAHIEELAIFAFSENFSAENSKFSEVSRNQRNQLLDCLDIGARMYILGKVRGKYDK